MKLYYFPGSCALADHIVLEWTGAPYEAVKLDRAATKSPQFLELNPSGAVPMLVRRRASASLRHAELEASLKSGR